MAKYTLEDIVYGDKYGIECAVFAETFKMAQQGINAIEIKEQLNTIYVKHALLVAKKMHEEGDCILICTPKVRHFWRCISFLITKLQSTFNMLE